MSTFVMTINTEGEAFEGEALPHELRRCIADVWHRLEMYPVVDEGVIRDANGNTCGVWAFEPDREQRLNNGVERDPGPLPRHG